VPAARSWGDADSRHASRSASGICASTSSSRSVVPAPIVVPLTPFGTALRRSTSVSAATIRSRRSGTRSVPPARATAPLPSSPAAAATESGRASSTRLFPLRDASLQRVVHLAGRPDAKRLELLVRFGSRRDERRRRSVHRQDGQPGARRDVEDDPRELGCQPLDEEACRVVLERDLRPAALGPSHPPP